MKKILSSTLAALLLVSMIPTAMAAWACPFCGSTSSDEDCLCGGYVCDDCRKCDTCTRNDHSQGTQVTYTATGTESYTVTVPAQLAPGNGGDVVAQGTWASNRKLVVTADADVTLTNSINAADQKVLDVTFPGIALKGSNTAAVTATETVGVGNIDNALFGTWSGTFNYNVAMEFELKEGYLDGTWKFNETLTDAKTQKDINFTVNGVSYFGFKVEFDDGTGGGWSWCALDEDGYEEAALYQSYKGGWSDAGWQAEGYDTITFTSEQQVSMEFWNWFTANATRIG